MTRLLSILIGACLLGPGYASGSDMQTARSPLYPYNSSVFLQDEFLTGTSTTGLVGSLGWSMVGCTAQGGLANRPGFYRCDTSGVSGTLSRINWAVSGSFDVSSPHQMIWVTRLNTNDANTTVRYGSSSAVASNPPAAGIYFEKLDVDTNWFCVTRASSTSTRTDSTVTTTTNFATFAYSLSTAGVQFWINGVAVCGTHTTNIPTGTVSPFAFIINSAADSKTFDVDYFQFFMTGMTR